ncbi:prepilin peptidase [Amycolatopsis sp. cmx-11-32]|uniref:prepilin peptidase n=1 Tax=Amycolatopsis sp. cmx-11-32 TaxID=2785796 RepID=UPI0039E4335F
MVSVAMLAAGAGSLASGPVLLAAVERTTSTVVASGAWRRRAVAAALSATTAALSWAGWVRLGATPIWPAWCWACALGCGLALTDLRCRRLPFSLVATLAGGGATLLFAVTVVDGSWSRYGLACLAAVAVYCLASLVQFWAPEHTGGGDTALYAALALFLGWFGWDGLVQGLVIASGLTAVVALVVLVTSKSVNSRFPAGPSLIAGALLGILWG